LIPVTFFLPLPAPEVWRLLLATAAIHLAYQVLMVNSYRLGDFSVVYPIARGLAPLLIGMGAMWFLNEPLTLIQVTALIVVSLGMMGFAIDAARKEARRSVQMTALVFAVATAFAIACYTLVDAAGVRLALNPLTFIVWLFVLSGIAINVVALAWRGNDYRRSVRREWRGALLAGLLSIVGYGVFLYALRLGSTVELAALRETSILFAAAYGAILFKESFGLARLAGTIFIVMGVIGLRLA